MQSLFADVAGPTSTSSGGAHYWLMIVDDAINVGWRVFLPYKSAATATLGFHTFLAAVNDYGKPKFFRTDNTSEFIRTEVLADNNIRHALKSVDGAKHNGRVERKLNLVAERGHAAFWEFQTMYDGEWFRPRHSTMIAQDRKHGRAFAKRST